MTKTPTPHPRATARRFVRAVVDLLTSDVRGSAWLLIGLLLLFALAVNGLNVVNSYVGRDFMTAVAEKDMPGFVRLALLYVAMFAVITVAAVLYSFTEQRLALLWRGWLTRKVVTRYLDDRTYLRLKASAEIGNPDQRIAEDIRAFTATTLSFTLIFLNAALAAISFSGVLWSISPPIFAVAVAYAAVGTLLTVLLGRPLVGLNYRQSDREAEFRADLIHVRENADSIAILRREGRLRSRLNSRLEAVLTNFKRIIAVNRNLSFFTTGYNYLVPVVPTLLIAPSYIRGEIDFGVITQAGLAFAQLLGAFSLIVNQFGSISSFAAVVARLSSLAEGVEASPQADSVIRTIEASDIIRCDALTLRVPHRAEPLVTDLNMTVPRGQFVHVVGNESASMALFHAIAGIWPQGTGQITRPPLDDVLFLPKKPYLVPGTLREVLVRSGRDRDISDQQLRDALHAGALDELVDRIGGLDVESDWASRLSLRELQQLAITRVCLARPSYALLDRLSTTLGEEGVPAVLQRFHELSITAIVFDTDRLDSTLPMATLRLHDDRRWTWLSAQRPPFTAA